MKRKKEIIRGGIDGWTGMIEGKPASKQTNRCTNNRPNNGQVLLACGLATSHEVFAKKKQENEVNEKGMGRKSRLLFGNGMGKRGKNKCQPVCFFFHLFFPLETGLSFMMFGRRQETTMLDAGKQVATAGGSSLREQRWARIIPERKFLAGNEEEKINKYLRENEDRLGMQSANGWKRRTGYFGQVMRLRWTD